MSKVDVFNCVRSAIPFPTGNETTTGVSQNENSVFKNYKSGVVVQNEIWQKSHYLNIIINILKNNKFKLFKVWVEND